MDDLLAKAKEQAEKELRDSIKDEVRKELFADIVERQKANSDVAKKEAERRGRHIIDNLTFDVIADGVVASYVESDGREYSKFYRLSDILSTSDLPVKVYYKTELKNLNFIRNALSGYLQKLEVTMATFKPRRGCSKPRYRIKAIGIPMAAA
jgi:hypothetical protein